MDMRLLPFAHTILYSLKLEHGSCPVHDTFSWKEISIGLVTHKDSWNKKEKKKKNYFFSILNSVEGIYLPLATQQAGATTRFRDTRAFYVA